MMIDGHSGIENRKVNEGGADDFQLALAYLKQGTGRGDFVIHATSSASYSFGLQPVEFLASIGLDHYEGHCPFYRDRCFYRVIATFNVDLWAIRYDRKIDRIHTCFKEFASKIGELFRLRQQQDRILKDIGVELPAIPLFGPPVQIQISEKDVPLWVNEVKFPQLQELERQRDTIQKQIDELSRYLPLLYGTGDLLVEAVIKALRFLGIDAERAPEGFTADILAQAHDGLRKFGFEVTGISGPIKKDSKKLTQVVDFERVKEHGEKTILLANTHNATPIDERKDLEDFTQQVVDFLSPYPILLMTGWELYCMVRDVLQGSRTSDEIAEILHTSTGRLHYGPRA